MSDRFVFPTIIKLPLGSSNIEVECDLPSSPKLIIVTKFPKDDILQK